MLVSTSKISKSEGGDPWSSATTCFIAGVGVATICRAFGTRLAVSPALRKVVYRVNQAGATTGPVVRHFFQ